MVLIKKKEQVTAEYILSSVGEYSIYRYYIGEFIIGGVRQNPFTTRQETPSFGIYLKDGKLYHSDFAVPEYHGDCIALVQQLYQLSYSRAIEKIAGDFNLSTGTGTVERIKQQYIQPIMDEKRYSHIQVTAKKWDKRSLQYWEDYGISQQQLRQEEIYNVKEWYLNRKRQVIEKGELCYAYRFPTGMKIYYPHRTGKDKWRTNAGKIVENEAAIEKYDTIVISKSRKDRIVLSNILPQIGVINLQNEGPSSYTEELIEKLKHKKRVLISFDSDTAGKKASIAMNEKYPWMGHINVPDWFCEERGLKDWADVYMVCGPEPIVQHYKKKGII